MNLNKFNIVKIFNKNIIIIFI